MDAFFAKTVDDTGIDVHAEGQLITRAVLNPGAGGWDCTTHPQPTLQDLRVSMGSAAARNVKLLHLSGHGRRECGFLLNADDAATASAPTDIQTLIDLISGAAGQRGPLECAVLNACSTMNMGRLLRKAGMSHVVCWKTPVHDETAREFCHLFYQALVEQTRESPSHRNYRDAFTAATDAMRVHAFSGGTAQLPPEAAGASVGKGVRKGGGLATDVHLLASPLREHVGTAQRTRAKVMPWQEEDAIQLLSEDGDSEVIYLWRRRGETAQPAHTDRETEQVRREVLVFCSQCHGDKNDMQGEGQKIVSIIEGLPGNKLSCRYNPRPSLQDLQGQLRRASGHVFGLHFIGHGDEGGLYLVSEDGRQPARINASSLAQMIEAAQSLEVCLLNACDTESLGLELERGGLKHVVCWRGPVADAVAHKFSQEFYQTLNEEPGNYRKAFCQGKLAAKVLQDERWDAGFQRPLGSPCYFCASPDAGAQGHILPEPACPLAPVRRTSDCAEEDLEEDPDAPEVGNEVPPETSSDDGDTDETRSLNNSKGESELAALKALGFVLDFNRYSIEAGIKQHSQGKLAPAEVGKYGLQEKVLGNRRRLLYLSNPAARHLFGVNSYTDAKLWHSDGPICRQAKAVQLPHVKKAIACFERSLEKRTPGADRGHDFMRERIVECVTALKAGVRERESAVT